MNGFQTFFMILCFIFLVYSTTIVMNFMGITFASYGFYLLWFCALIIIYFIIPRKKNYFS